tara:strand:+ start:1054 stop:1833 length:780 start_codon:yes stop_codon:yes gene_type:complete
MNFYKPFNLPKLMVAPNGSKRMKIDHENIPITIDEICSTAKACYNSGAEALHFHVRNNDGLHVLDSGLYKEALAELNLIVPKMHLQITTESIGIYSPEQMRNLIYNVDTPGISIGIKEMIPSTKPTVEDIKVYKYLVEKGTKIQHICYFPEELEILSKLIKVAELPNKNTWCMFTIGHYTGRKSNPNLIPMFLDSKKKNQINGDWAICAFSVEEKECIKKAISLNGNIRVGFENSIHMFDGSMALNNESKVKEVLEYIN